MNTLLIACGNSLRGDDGVAHEVLRLMECGRGCEMRHARHVYQWVPELAEEISRFQRVVFMDADVGATEPLLKLVGDEHIGSPLSHAASPIEIVALSRALFGFEGEALVYRIPAGNFDPDEQLSADQQHLAGEASRELQRLLDEADGPSRAPDAKPQNQRDTTDDQTCRAGNLV